MNGHFYDEARRFSGALGHCAGLSRLDLGGNDIRADGAATLAEMLEGEPRSRGGGGEAQHERWRTSIQPCYFGKSQPANFKSQPAKLV